MATSEDEEEEEEEDELFEEEDGPDGDGGQEMQGKTGGGRGRKNGPKRRMQNAVAQKRFRQKKKQMTLQVSCHQMSNIKHTVNCY